MLLDLDTVEDVRDLLVDVLEQSPDALLSDATIDTEGPDVLLITPRTGFRLRITLETDDGDAG